MADRLRQSILYLLHLQTHRKNMCCGHTWAYPAVVARFSSRCSLLDEKQTCKDSPVSAMSNMYAAVLSISVSSALSRMDLFTQVLFVSPTVSGDHELIKRQKHSGRVLNLLCCSQTAALMLKITDGGSDSRLQFHETNARWQCCLQTCLEKQVIQQIIPQILFHLS